MSIHLKRAYEHPARADGYRILVDRLWPHGVSKAELQFDIWAKDLAPSADLRAWFDHDPGKWEEFKRRYFHELDAHRAAVEPILSLLSRATVTLVFAAKDRLFNNAVALKEYLEKPQHRAQLLSQIKTEEHRADEVMADLGRRIHRSFITPIDREDIHTLASKLDDTIDVVDSIARRSDMLRIGEDDHGVG